MAERGFPCGIQLRLPTERLLVGLLVARRTSSPPRMRSTSNVVCLSLSLARCLASSWPLLSCYGDLGWPRRGYGGIFLLAVVCYGVVGVQLARTNAGCFRDANMLRKMCEVACKEGHLPFFSSVSQMEVGSCNFSSLKWIFVYDIFFLLYIEGRQSSEM